MVLKLVSPSLCFKKSYHDYILELGDEERYPFPLDFEYQDFPALLKRLEEFKKGKNLPNGYVPSSTYWLVDDSELIGVSNLRHYLNDQIRECGGHIGLGIRPGYRGKGLSSLLLAKTLDKAKNKGIDQVHIHCHKHNTASARMILRNGGVLDSEIQEPGSTEMIQRYLVRC